MRHVAIAFALALALGLAACGGYWLGFRHAWDRSLQAEAPLRASLAIGNLRLLDQGRLSDLRVYYDSEIDFGLMWWAQLEEAPSYRLLNVLSGQDVVPDYERYVRRAAVYRRTNPSRVRDPAVVESMLKAAREANPAFALELEQGGREAGLAIDRMVKKYGQ
jgi:hypothetical protein